jgi:hypothetical protein
MRAYQTLSLIGCIFGILVAIAWGATLGFLSVLSQQSQSQEQFQTTFGAAIVGIFFAFIIYIVLLVLTFTMNNKPPKTTSRVKVLGIILVVGGVITTAITNLWGIIALALLLPAGIVALRHKEETTTTTTTTV